MQSNLWLYVQTFVQLTWILGLWLWKILANFFRFLTPLAILIASEALKGLDVDLFRNKTISHYFQVFSGWLDTYYW